MTLKAQLWLSLIFFGKKVRISLLSWIFSVFGELCCTTIMKSLSSNKNSSKYGYMFFIIEDYFILDDLKIKSEKPKKLFKMKIDRLKLKKSSSEVPADCKGLNDRLTSTSIKAEFLSELQRIEQLWISPVFLARKWNKFTSFFLTWELKFCCVMYDHYE